MAIQYKKIIKEIMGPEATENGFKPGELGPAGIMKRTLASYEKEFDKYYSQGFDIELDTFMDELELLSIGIREVRSFDRDDAESFRNVINQFAQIMREKGYSLLEKDACIPRFSTEDYDSFYENYRRLSEEFYVIHKIDRSMPLADRLRLVNELVAMHRNEEFVDVKSELLTIAAFYTTTLLECEETRVIDYPGYSTRFCVGGLHRGVTCTLESVLALWLSKNNINIIKSDCSVVLKPEQFSALEWKF